MIISIQIVQNSKNYNFRLLLFATFALYYPMINQLIISSACCCLQFCCTQLAQTLLKIIGKVAFIKIMYSLIYFSFIGFVYLAMYLLKQWQFFTKMISSSITCLSITTEFDCVSASVIYRITLSLFAFSTLMLFTILLCSFRIARILNQGLFFTKFVITIVLFFITLQLDNTLIVLFSHFSQIFSYTFIVWQVIILIDLAYLWGIRWAQQYSNGSYLYSCFLIIFTVINYTLAIAINAYGYILSNSDQEEACRNYPNIISTIMIVALFGIQLLNYNKQNSLLATSALTMFNSYWLLSAVFSTQNCNASIILADSQTTIAKSLFLQVNIPISCLFVLISSFGSIHGSTNEEQSQHFIQLQETGVVAINKRSEQVEESISSQRKMWVRWHLFNMAMSLYIGMVMTDWGSGDILKGKFTLTPNASISKIFTASITFFLYCWTLLAPRLFPSRSFCFR